MTSPTPSSLAVPSMGPATWNSSLYWPVSRSSLRSCCVRVSKFVLGMVDPQAELPVFVSRVFQPVARVENPWYGGLALRDLQHDLDRVAALHELKSAVEFFKRQLVRDDRVELQPPGQ